MAGGEEDIEQFVKRGLSQWAIVPGYGTVAGLLMRNVEMYVADGARAKDWDRAAKALSVLGMDPVSAPGALEDVMALSNALIPGRAGIWLRHYVEHEALPRRLAGELVEGASFDGALREDFERKWKAENARVDAEFFGRQFMCCLAMAAGKLLMEPSAGHVRRAQVVDRFEELQGLLGDDGLAAFGVNFLIAIVAEHPAREALRNLDDGFGSKWAKRPSA